MLLPQRASAVQTGNALDNLRICEGRCTHATQRQVANKRPVCRQLQKQKEKPGEFLIYPLIDLKCTDRKAGLPFTDCRCVPLLCSTCITYAGAHEHHCSSLVCQL